MRAPEFSDEQVVLLSDIASTGFSGAESGKVKIGDSVVSGDEVGVVYCRRQNQADVVSDKLKNAYKITRAIPKTTKLIRAVV